ncbi:hypothetical protein D6833_03085 [Candidatus Parcubacteria bacterium]|nr:MAG: hypothetical protein D6833_03085 [Candidatus Parcubacteria bacterium]
MKNAKLSGAQRRCLSKYALDVSRAGIVAIVVGAMTGHIGALSAILGIAAALATLAVGVLLIDNG